MNFDRKQFYPLCLLILLVAIFPNLQAQESDNRLEQKQKRDIRLPLRSPLDKELSKDQSKRKPSFGSEREFKMQALEASVEPDSYIVGPGDVFLISIWSMAEASFAVEVNPEGKLIVPTIGSLQVDGRTLSEVQKIVKEAGAKKYLNSPITVDLVSLRTFRVHVTGQVMNPGLYRVFAVDRVSGVIAQAGGLTNWASERSIQVRHRDGTVDSVDLYEYHKLGLLDSNIYLKGGDVIYVPPIDFTHATVRVEGLVNDPGIYQLAENETLQDLLLRVNALNKRADLEVAYIKRNSQSNDGTETIPIFPYLQNQVNGFSDLYLQDGDVIMIPQRQEEVYVVGAVRNPGPYAYYPNLQAIDYVGFAGSTERAVTLSKIKVFRKEANKEERGQNVLIQPGDTVFIAERFDFGIREITAVVVTLTNVLVTMKALDVF